MAPQRPTGRSGQRTRPTPTLFRRVALAGALFLWLLFGWTNPAHAASYTFPGNMPLGCVGLGGNYTCVALTLSASVTVTIGVPTPATITVNGKE